MTGEYRPSAHSSLWSPLSAMKRGNATEGKESVVAAADVVVVVLVGAGVG